MTDRIDLDDIDTPDDDEPTPNRGDWFWRGEGDPADEPAPPDDPPSGAGSAPHDGGGDAEAGGAAAADGDATATDGDADGPIPRVPYADESKPVGIPKETGGAGGASVGAASAGEAGGAREAEATDASPGATAGESGGDAPAASGPHGGGADEMTMALTYRAASRLTDPAAAFADASGWADWLGIVGDVAAPVINKFQREHTIDADFFNGSGTGPAERLTAIDRHSMFFAERMVVVGLDDERPIAEEADWEFVPLEEAAAKAGWELDEGDGDDG